MAYKMRVLVTGAAGQLGRDVTRQLEERGIEYRGVDAQDFALTDGQAVMRAVTEYAPTAIVHCAAYTDVDRAESEPEICTAINGMGTLNMARAALAANAKMVYISSDYVFSGEGNQPFRPEDAYGPVNVYGLSKVQGENAVRSLMTRYFLLRTSWLYGRYGQNFARTMLRLGAEQKELRVVSDQIGSPTYTRDLARVICDLLPTSQYGVYHVHNEGYVSRAGFARMIMEKAGLHCTIIPVLTSEYPTAARRPLNSRLAGYRLEESGIAPMPGVEDALDRFLREIDL